MSDEYFITEYTFRPLPWISKSTLTTYKFCRRAFERKYILKKDIPIGQTASNGTNMHVIASKFFDVINYKKLFKCSVYPDVPLRENRITSFMINTIKDILPIGAERYLPYRKILTNFALLEAHNYIRLHTKYKGNPNKILKYYPPIVRERYNEHRPSMTFGTTDRINLEEDDEVEYRYILDYKTGRVPISVKRGPKNKNNMLSYKLPPIKMLEIHFYAMLYAFYNGATLHPEILDHITNSSRFIGGAKVPKVDEYFFDRDGDPFDFSKIIVGFAYISRYEDKPYVPIKSVNRKSFAALFRAINVLRTALKYGGPWDDKPNYYKCGKFCSLNPMEECLSEEEKELVFGKDYIERYLKENKK